MLLSRVVTHEGERKTLCGFADYTLWYDSTQKKSLATNLLIVEAKKFGTSGTALPQLIAYMGIVHATRKAEGKDNAIVFGAASDGHEFRFCRINNNGDFTRSKVLEWEYDSNLIYSIMRSIVRVAALSSPSTTPIRDPEKRKIVMSGFGSPSQSEKFDYGHGKFQIYYEEDLEEGDEIVTWKDWKDGGAKKGGEE